MSMGTIQHPWWLEETMNIINIFSKTSCSQFKGKAGLKAQDQSPKWSLHNHPKRKKRKRTLPTSNVFTTDKKVTMPDTVLYGRIISTSLLDGDEYDDAYGDEVHIFHEFGDSFLSQD